MDTTWFAVDRDGHIAAFESAEGGAVPENAVNDQQGAIDPLAEIVSHATPCEPIYALQDRQSPLTTVHHAEPQKHYRQIANPGFVQRLVALFKGTSAPTAPVAYDASSEAEQLIAPVLMFFADPHVAADAVADGNGQPVKSVDRNAVLFMNLPLAVYRSLHDRGACPGCFYMFELSPYEGIEPREYSKFGLYHYNCCEDQLAVPYGRHTIPDKPLEIDQLPPELRDEFVRLQFTDLSFADTPYIQPASRTKSFCWDGGYLAEDFKTFKANPGQEDEYKECYKNMTTEGYINDFKFEPPNG
jgi:hypothetical protein